MPIAYTVRCTFSDEATARDWAAWLREAHLDDVLDAGAERASLVRLDGPGIAYEARYRFPDRAAFDAYITDHAPRLRAEGLARFPLDLGLDYTRCVGEVVVRRRRGD
jgi:hypothetical protein